jgi:hypothetical protein
LQYTQHLTLTAFAINKMNLILNPPFRVPTSFSFISYSLTFTIFTTSTPPYFPVSFFAFPFQPDSLDSYYIHLESIYLLSVSLDPSKEATLSLVRLSTDVFGPALVRPKLKLFPPAVSQHYIAKWRTWR